MEINTYTQDGGLILKNGVILTVAETVKLLNKLQKTLSRWHQLRTEIGRYYEIQHESTQEEEITMLDIAETTLKALGYL